MTAPPLSLPAADRGPPPAALPAFLRGVERRAALLAELQCGDPVAGDAALFAAMRAFRAGAGHLPLAQWPLRFWSLLLAAPALRRVVPAAAWEPHWRGLAALGNGTRAALLLRMVAGLDADTAAAALGVAPTGYQQVLARTVLRDAAGQPLALQSLEDALQQRLRRLPAPRLVQLAQLRERALADGSPGPKAAAPAPTRSRWLLPLWLGVAACVLAFAATFWPMLPAGVLPADLLPPGLGGRLASDGGPRIRSVPLPPMEPPAARFDPDFAHAAHRDFGLLADPEGVRRAQALPLMAWYAAELAATRAASPAAAALPERDLGAPEAAVVDPAASVPALPGPEPVAGPSPGAFLLPPLAAQLQQLPAALRAPLRAQLATWSGWNEAQRAGWIERERAWADLPAEARREQRERHAAWRALPASARDEVAAAALAFALLPQPEQQALQARFSALDHSSQRGWLLGPALGADYPRLQPLLAQLPAAEHAPLLATLQAMSVAERADLAVLAQRVPPHERDALRRALLSTSADNRGAWLRLRLDQ